MDIIRSIAPSTLACAAMSAIMLLIAGSANSSLGLLVISILVGILSYGVVISFVAPTEVKRIRNSLGINK